MGKREMVLSFLPGLALLNGTAGSWDGRYRRPPSQYDRAGVFAQRSPHEAMCFYEPPVRVSLDVFPPLVGSQTLFVNRIN